MDKFFKAGWLMMVAGISVQPSKGDNPKAGYRRAISKRNGHDHGRPRTTSAPGKRRVGSTGMVPGFPPLDQDEYHFSEEDSSGLLPGASGSVERCLYLHECDFTS